MAERHPAARCFHHWPTRGLCLAVLLIQTMSVNWYLMENLSFVWAAIFGADVVVFALFAVAFYMAALNIYTEKHTDSPSVSELFHQPFTYISWLVYAIVLDVKVVTIFSTFSTELDEDQFFGPNTLKSSIALSGIVFLLFLPTQHDIGQGHRKDMLTALTSTIIFDVLDGVDFLDNLFEKDVRETFPPELDDVIIAIFCINTILPSVPLFTLAKTNFGLKKLPERLELFHKFSIAYLINLPLFITRMITWHGLSQGISIFLLKNIIAMGIVTFEVCEHFLCKTKIESDQPNNESFSVALPYDDHRYDDHRYDGPNGGYMSNTAI